MLKSSKMNIGIIIVISILLFSIAMSIIAKYMKTHLVDDINNVITDFDVYTEMYFMDGNDTVPVRTDPLFENFVAIDLGNPNAPNYIDKFRCDVFYRGQSSFYMRVNLNIFITDLNVVDGSTYLSVPNNLFNIPRYDLTLAPQDQAKWFDNLKADNNLYWAQVANTPKNDKYEKEVVIDGAYIDTDPSKNYNPNDHKDQVMFIDVGAESVQINRYHAFWKLTELPWKN